MSRGQSNAIHRDIGQNAAGNTTTIEQTAMQSPRRTDAL